MTMFFVSIVCVLPSAAFTSTLPVPRMRPVPANASILFFLNRNATPLMLPSTAWSLNFSSVGRSSSGAETLMPIFANLWPASSNSSEA